VVETEDSVTVYFTTDTPSGDQTCPGGPLVDQSIVLDRQVGGRTLRDGSTWPPTPISGF
jgi:hypothetical protein